MEPLAERLGYRPDAKLVVVNADDLGLCCAANVGVYECLGTGVVTSASLMVPCPWAREAAARYRGQDVGVHLTVNAEWELYRWGPITHAPSLLGGDGGFAPTMEDVWDHADLDEVRRECRAQVERAILWGFDVSHIDAHMGTLQLRPEFFDVYLDLALEFSLPVRLAEAPPGQRLGFPAGDVAREAGVVFIDRVLSLPLQPAAGEGGVEEQLSALDPGLTELHLRPAVDTPELRAIADDWRERVEHHRVVCQGELARALAATGVTPIGYRPLRELARDGR